VFFIFEVSIKLHKDQ